MDAGRTLLKPTTLGWCSCECTNTSLMTFLSTCSITADQYGSCRVEARWSMRLTRHMLPTIAPMSPATSSKYKLDTVGQKA